MSTIIVILLIIAAIIVVAGIIRVIIHPCDSIWDFFLDIFFLDCLGDLLGAIIDGIMDNW